MRLGVAIHVYSAITCLTTQDYYVQCVSSIIRYRLYIPSCNVHCIVQIRMCNICALYENLIEEKSADFKTVNANIRYVNQMVPLYNIIHVWRKLGKRWSY